MKASLDGDDLAPARDAQRELECVLVRLGARVAEEDRVERQRRETHQPRGGSRAHVERHGVALEGKRMRLLGERREPARVAVAQRRDRVTPVEIEHASAVARHEVHARGTDDVERKLRVDRCEVIGRSRVNGCAGYGGDACSTLLRPSGPARCR